MAKRIQTITSFDGIPAADRKSVITLHKSGCERHRNGRKLSPQQIYQRLIEARTELGIATTKPALTATDGRALAAAMLRELKSSDGDECGLIADYRDGRPQNNVALRYLEQLRIADNPALTAGFSGALTDFISTLYVGGSVTNIEFYEKDSADQA